MSNKPYILRGRESFCFEYKPKISNMEILRDGTHTKKSIVSHRATYTSSIPDEETSRPRVYVDVTPSMYGTLHTQWYTMMCVARETKSTSVLPEVVTWWQSICSFLDSCFQSRKKVFTVRGGPKQCILFLLFLGEEGVSHFFALPTFFGQGILTFISNFITAKAGLPGGIFSLQTIPDFLLFFSSVRS